MTRMLRFSLALSVAAVLASAASSSWATPIVLTDANATVTVDYESSSGISSWVTDGRSDLNQEWFWYRVGPAGGEASADTLNLVFVKASDGDADAGNERLVLRYDYQEADTYFQIDIDLTLSGGLAGSSVSDLAETITISNLSTTSNLDFHFFEYSDFDLSNDPIDDIVQLTNANLMEQGDGSVSSGTTILPSGDHYEVGFFDTTLSSLMDGAPTTLNDTLGSIGPGNLTWAVQWDFLIAPGGSAQISKNKNLIPEPGTALLFAFGMIGLALLGKRPRA